MLSSKVVDIAPLWDNDTRTQDYSNAVICDGYFFLTA